MIFMKMRMKMKRFLRHLKYWVALKMFPDDELNFLVVPQKINTDLKELVIQNTYSKANHDFFGEELIKDNMLRKAHKELKECMRYEEVWSGEVCICNGYITVSRQPANKVEGVGQ